MRDGSPKRRPTRRPVERQPSAKPRRPVGEISDRRLPTLRLSRGPIQPFHDVIPANPRASRHPRRDASGDLALRWALRLVRCQFAAPPVTPEVAGSSPVAPSLLSAESRCYLAAFGRARDSHSPRRKNPRAAPSRIGRTKGALRIVLPMGACRGRRSCPAAAAPLCEVNSRAEKNSDEHEAGLSQDKGGDQ
jgi:hypothetical protein